MRRMAFGLLLIGIVLGLPRLAHQFRGEETTGPVSALLDPPKTRTETPPPAAQSQVPRPTPERLPSAQVKNPVSQSAQAGKLPFSDAPSSPKLNLGSADGDEEPGYLPPGTTRQKTATADRAPVIPAPAPQVAPPPIVKPPLAPPPLIAPQKAVKPAEPKPAPPPAMAEGPLGKPVISPQTPPPVVSSLEKPKPETPKPLVASREETKPEDNSYDDIYYPSRYRKNYGRRTVRVRHSRRRYASIEVRPYLRRRGGRLSSRFRTANFSWPGQ